MVTTRSSRVGASRQREMPSRAPASDPDLDQSSDEDGFGIPAVASKVKQRSSKLPTISPSRRQSRKSHDNAQKATLQSRKRFGAVEDHSPTPKRRNLRNRPADVEGRDAEESASASSWGDEAEDEELPGASDFFAGINRRLFSEESLVVQKDSPAPPQRPKKPQRLVGSSDESARDPMEDWCRSSIDILHEEALELAKHFYSGSEHEHSITTNGAALPAQTDFQPAVDAIGPETLGGSVEPAQEAGANPMPQESGQGAVQSVHPSARTLELRAKTRNKAKASYGDENYFQPGSIAQEEPLGAVPASVQIVANGSEVEVSSNDVSDRREPPMRSDPYDLPNHDVEEEPPVAEAHMEAERTAARPMQRRHGVAPASSSPALSDQADVQPEQGNQEVEAHAADDHSRNNMQEETEIINDDSLCFEAPSRYDRCTVAHVKLRNDLSSIFRLMGFRGWTEEGKDWEDELLVRARENKGRWKARIQKRMYDKSCRNLVPYIHHLWERCHEAPKAPDMSDQAAYLTERRSDIQKSLATIEKMVDRITSKLVDDPNAQLWTAREVQQRKGTVVNSLCSTIIPLLVLVFKEAACLGGAMVEDGQIKVCPESHFTSSVMMLILRIAGWIERLYNAVQELLPVLQERETTGKKRRGAGARRKLQAPFTRLGQSLERGMDELDEIANAPARRLAAMEKDRVAKMERERRREEYEVARERQMQLFIESMRTGWRASATVTRPEHGQPGHADVDDDNDDYWSKQGGWHYWEDNKLLDVIRTVTGPNVEEAARGLRGRTADEVARRIAELRDRARRKYEASGIPPPHWCYHLE